MYITLLRFVNLSQSSDIQFYFIITIVKHCADYDHILNILPHAQVSHTITSSIYQNNVTNSVKNINFPKCQHYISKIRNLLSILCQVQTHRYSSISLKLLNNILFAFYFNTRQ